MNNDRLTRLKGDERLGANRDSEYLGAEDIDPGAQPILTIDGLWNGEVTLQRGKENKDVLTFVETKVKGLSQVRPMIINATNRKVLKGLYGGVSANILEGKKIQLYVDEKVRDPQGGITSGIRIRNRIPKGEKPVPLCSDCGSTIEAAFGKTAEGLAAYTLKHYNRALCAACAQKAKQQLASDTEQKEVNVDTDEQ